MRYRAEIDGLRAVAVLPVILYHARIEGFSGGFVGVDIFFVISGYLITGVLMEQQSRGSLSLVSFYERRVRRILPALLVVCLACIVPAWLWMLPTEFIDVGKSIVAVNIFLSNFYFWHTLGYFAVGTAYVPLIHTWSLGVEEQFYLLFPLLLVLLRRVPRAGVIAVFAVGSLLSLALAQVMSGIHPGANFYLLPSRAWELGIGAILCVQTEAWRAAASPHRPRRLIDEIAAILGLVMIAYAVVAFDDSVPFPSILALIPVVGTALVLRFAEASTLAGRVLTFKPLVGMGLISYSAYLWHQPVLVFARILSDGRLPPITLAALIALSLGLAYLSWRFVEKPFRQRARFSRRQIFAGAAAAGIVVSGFGAAFASGLIAPTSNPRIEMADAYAHYPWRRLWRYRHCFLGPGQGAKDFDGDCFVAGNELTLWGDSHAAALYPGLVHTEGGTRGVNQLTAYSCPPVLNYWLKHQPGCEALNNDIFQTLHGYRGIVVLHANWHIYDADPAFWPAFSDTLHRLQRSSIRFAVVMSVPAWYPSAPLTWLHEESRSIHVGDTEFVPNRAYESVSASDHKLAQIVTAAGGTVISPMLDLCVLKRRHYCAIARTGSGGTKLYQWDSGHLTRTGSFAVGKIIASSLR